MQESIPVPLFQSRTLVPLRFVAENSGYHVYFADKDGIFGIGRTEELADPGIIESVPEPAPEFDPVSPEPYFVKGKVVNSLVR